MNGSAAPMPLFPLGDKASPSGTGTGLLLRLSFWRMCQTPDEVGRAHTLLVSLHAGRHVDESAGASAALGSS